MKHVNLDGQDASVRDFILSLASEPDGSVLELAGRPVARMLPVSAGSNGAAVSDNEWTDAKNNRRCELVDRKIHGTLTADEVVELDDLQQQMLHYRDRVAPLPLDYARKLHQELLKRAQVADTGTGA